MAEILDLLQELEDRISGLTEVRLELVGELLDKIQAIQDVMAQA